MSPIILALLIFSAAFLYIYPVLTVLVLIFACIYLGRPRRFIICQYFIHIRDIFIHLYHTMSRRTSSNAMQFDRYKSNDNLHSRNINSFSMDKSRFDGNSMGYFAEVENHSPNVSTRFEKSLIHHDSILQHHDSVLQHHTPRQLSRYPEIYRTSHSSSKFHNSSPLVQSKYANIGYFPTIRLEKSPTSILKPTPSKGPVTVKIAAAVPSSSGQSTIQKLTSSFGANSPLHDKRSNLINALRQSSRKRDKPEDCESDSCESMISDLKRLKKDACTSDEYQEESVTTNLDHVTNKRAASRDSSPCAFANAKRSMNNSVLSSYSSSKINNLSNSLDDDSSIKRKRKESIGTDEPNSKKSVTRIEENKDYRVPSSSKIISRSSTNVPVLTQDAKVDSKNNSFESKNKRRNRLMLKTSNAAVTYFPTVKDQEKDHERDLIRLDKILSHFLSDDKDKKKSDSFKDRDNNDKNSSLSTELTSNSILSKAPISNTTMLKKDENKPEIVKISSEANATSPSTKLSNASISSLNFTPSTASSLSNKIVTTLTTSAISSGSTTSGFQPLQSLNTLSGVTPSSNTTTVSSTITPVSKEVILPSLNKVSSSSTLIVDSTSKNNVESILSKAQSSITNLNAKFGSSDNAIQNKITFNSNASTAASKADDKALNVGSSLNTSAPSPFSFGDKVSQNSIISSPASLAMPKLDFKSGLTSNSATKTDLKPESVSVNGTKSSFQFGTISTPLTSPAGETNSATPQFFQATNNNVIGNTLQSKSISSSLDSKPLSALGNLAKTVSSTVSPSFSFGSAVEKSDNSSSIFQSINSATGPQGGFKFGNTSSFNVEPKKFEVSTSGSLNNTSFGSSNTASINGPSTKSSAFQFGSSSNQIGVNSSNTQSSSFATDSSANLNSAFNFNKTNTSGTQASTGSNVFQFGTNANNKPPQAFQFGSTSSTKENTAMFNTSTPQVNFQPINAQPFQFGSTASAATNGMFKADSSAPTQRRIASARRRRH